MVDGPLADIESATRAVFRGGGTDAWPPECALEGLEDIGIARSWDDAVLRVQSFIDRIASTRM
ncbi:MAG TPA: hypothetical protein DEH05_09420 [Propionibacteriaceae bacterium]|nr:hypothetical protein [Propionibacteriaceae bacterium]